MCYEPPLKHKIPQAQLDIEDILIKVILEFWLDGQEFEDSLCDILEENAHTTVPIMHEGGVVVRHPFNGMVTDNLEFVEQMFYKITRIKEEMKKGIPHVEDRYTQDNHISI